MNNFITLLNAVERYAVQRLDGADREAFLSAMNAIKNEFEQTLHSGMSLESFVCFLITEECNYILRQRTFVWWANPMKYRLLAYEYAIDIAESMTKRFSSDMKRW